MALSALRGHAEAVIAADDDAQAASPQSRVGLGLRVEEKLDVGQTRREGSHEADGGADKDVVARGREGIEQRRVLVDKIQMIDHVHTHGESHPHVC